MASVRTRVKSQAKKKTSKLTKMFSSKKAKAPKKFSSSFEYGNLSVNIKNKASLVQCNLKLDNKNFNFSGTFTINEKSFSELHYMLNQLLSNVRHIKS